MDKIYPMLVPFSIFPLKCMVKNNFKNVFGNTCCWWNKEYNYAISFRTMSKLHLSSTVSLDFIIVFKLFLIFYFLVKDIKFKMANIIKYKGWSTPLWSRDFFSVLPGSEFRLGNCSRVMKISTTTKNKYGSLQYQFF